MVNYHLGKIYKIVCNITGLVYVGSTCEPTVAHRLTKHKCNFKSYKNGKTNYYTSFKILENNNYDIVLIELYPCESKDLLHARERYWIELLECVNKVIPKRTSKEYYIDNADKLKQYRVNNTDKYKQYCIDNADKIIEHKKKWYLKNKQNKLELNKLIV